jgi:hypothetical protein
MTIHRPLARGLAHWCRDLGSLTLILTLSNYSALILPIALNPAFYNILPHIF